MRRLKRRNKNITLCKMWVSCMSSLTCNNSLRRLYTRTLPSALERFHMDSSLNTTVLQCRWTLFCAHWRRSRRWRSVRMTPRWGLLQKIRRSLNRVLTVFLLTVRPQLPTTTENVDCDVVKRSRRWCWRIKTSCRTDVTRGAPERGLSEKLPVVFTHWASLAIVDLDTPKRLATSFCVIPAFQ